MSFVLRALAACAVGTAAVALAVWLAWEPLLDAARARIEPLLAEALHMPVRIGAADLTLRPLRLTLGDVALGEDGAVLRIRDGYLTVAVAESLRRREPVADLHAIDVEVAPLGFARPESEPDEAPDALPKFSLRRVRIANVRVLFPAPDAPLVITASEVKGRARARAGGLQMLVRAGDLIMTRGDRSLESEDLRAKLEVAGGDVIIRSATLDGKDVALRVAYDPRHKRHQVHAVAELAALDLIDPALREISGRVVVDGTMSGRFDAPHAEARVQAHQLMVADQALVDAAAQLRFSDKTLDVVSARFGHTTGSYAASGRLVIDDRLPFTLEADWKHASAPPVDATALWATATLAADGTLTPLRVNAEASGKAGRAANGDDAVDVSGSAQLADTTVQARATAAQKSGNSADATLSIDRTGNLDGVIRARVIDAPSWQGLLGTPVTPEVKGVLTADVRLSGTRAQPRLAGGIRGRDLNLFGASVTRVEADIRGDRQQLQVQRLDVRLSRGSIAGEGTFGLQADARNDWRIVAADIPTQTVVGVAAAAGVDLPLWGGQLALQATGGGLWSTAKLRAGLQLDDFYLQREPVDRLRLNVESAWPQWSADGRIELGPEEYLTLTASGNGTDTLTVALESSRWDLARVQTTSRLGLRGQVALRGTAQGPPTALNGNLHLTGAAVEWSGRALGDVAVEANGRAGRWTLIGKIGDLLTANGSLETRQEFPLQGTVEWNDADLAPLLQPDPNVRVLSSGTVRADGSLRAIDRMNASLQVDRLDVLGAEQGAPLLSVETPILIVAQGGRLEVRSLQLAGTGTEIAANGWLSAAGECDLALDARSNLALVEALSPAVDAARGNATITGRARRRAGAALELTGAATLERVAIDLGQPWVAVNVNGRMTFRDTILAIDTLTGRLAGGTFEVGGLVDLAAGPALTWTATEIAPSVIPDVEAEVSGKGSVRGTWSDITFAGEIEVLRALYDRRFALTDLIPLFQRQLAKPRSKEPSPAVIHLDLRIIAPDELFVDNNVAKIEMRTELALSGTTDALVIAGPIEVLSGEVKFRGRTFTIETGLIEFRPELGRQAYLNITARTVVPTAQATYTIDTHIVGTTDKYQITFTSDDPALSQTDLVSLVTFGKTAADLQQGGGGVSVNDLIALAPGLYEDQAEEQVQSLLGIDRVELEPGYSKSTGVYEPRVTLGKDLTQDLSASLSSTFGIQRRQQVQLEYRVSPRLSLLADWESATTDQAGAFGAEIKFRYPFRTFPGWAALLPWPGDDVQ